MDVYNFITYQIEKVKSFFLIQPGQLNQAVKELCGKVCEIPWRETQSEQNCIVPQGQGCSSCACENDLRLIQRIEKEQHFCVEQIERRNKELKKVRLEYKEKDEETKLAKNKVAASYNIFVSYYSSSLSY